MTSDGDRSGTAPTGAPRASEHDSADLVTVERRGDVLVVALDDPSTRNAVALPVYRLIHRALDTVAADPTIGAVVLTGTDGYFSSGGNLHGLATRRDMSPDERREMIEHLHRMVRRVCDLAVPVIAAVEGGAWGAGFALALSCDMIVAARDARFAVAYVKVGLSPDGGTTAFLSQALPRQLVTQMCLTGDPIRAARLYDLGVVNDLVDPGTALDTAVDLAHRLAHGPAHATERIKELCREAAGASVTSQLDREARLMVESQGDPESWEGIDAFREKRAPDFRVLRSDSGD